MRAVLLSILILIGLRAEAEPLVFAAASTARAMEDAMAQGGIAATMSFAASGTIARQIEQGAPADLFISANPRWMTHLVEIGLVDAASVVTLMSNALVLIAPEGAAPLPPEDALDAHLQGEVFVMADPGVAPVGRYGQQALESLGLWAAVSDKLVPTRNTLATVAAVAQGEAALGLVYASDARDVPGITVVATLPSASHAPIRYLAAPLSQGADAEGGGALLAYLLSAPAQAVFAAHGFLPVEGGS